MSARKKSKGRTNPNKDNRGAVRAPIRGSGGAGAGTRATTGPSSTTPKPATAQAEMCFVDIAAARIQQWINRTPRVRYRRGASNLLQEITSREQVVKYLPKDVSWNPAAGEVSGVVTLVLAPDRAADVRGQALGVAALVATRMRAVAPALEVSARYGVGTTYENARHDVDRRLLAEGPLLDLPPQLSEVPAAKTCDECRMSPAGAAQVAVVHERRSLCVDCHARAAAAGALGAGDDERLPKSQTALIAAVRDLLSGHPGRIVHPVDLSDLASMAKHRRAGDTPTQLATLSADGNRVGDFMTTLSDGGGGRGKHVARNVIVTAIDAATRGAVARAAAAMLLEDPVWSGGDEVVLPVLAHFIGGDDIAVSVPAVTAWPFLRHLTAEFDQVLRAQIEAEAPAAGSSGLKWPTLSAGVVFHHRAAPIPDVLTKAHEQMAAAKRHNAGAGPAVSFLDLTADGASVPQTRSADMSWLNDHVDLLDSAARVPRAQRSQLAALLRECAADLDSPSGVEDPVQALHRRLKTMAIPAMTEAAGADLGRTPESRQRLRTVLDIARWWAPGRPGEEH